jgi:hypothetical protein
MVFRDWRLDVRETGAEVLRYLGRFARTGGMPRSRGGSRTGEAIACERPEYVGACVKLDYILAALGASSEDASAGGGQARRCKLCGEIGVINPWARRGRRDGCRIWTH